MLKQLKCLVSPQIATCPCPSNVILLCMFQECPCLVDKDFLASLQSVSVTPVSSLLLYNISDGVELQSGDTLVHDCSTW